MISVKRALRVYADTSVFGGCFDDEFRTESVRFFEEVRSGPAAVPDRGRELFGGIGRDPALIPGCPSGWTGFPTTLRPSRWQQIFGAELVVSWYEGVNSLRGYRSPEIYSPREVVKN